MRLGIYVPAKASQLVIESDGKMAEEAQQVKAAADAAEAPRTAAINGATKERLEHSIRKSVAVRACFVVLFRACRFNRNDRIGSTCGRNTD